MNRNGEVDAFLDALDHARKSEVQRLRLAILASDKGLSETVKWNAPNFVFDGQDRVTFRLKPGDRVELILHRGAKVRADSAGFRFSDPDGVITWATPDRGVVVVSDGEDLATREPSIVALVKRWVRA